MTQRELSKIRTGRPNPKLFDNLLVESYGDRMPMVALAQNCGKSTAGNCDQAVWR
ncbi:ribosome recycling factor [Mycoplasmoides pneumoniae]|uniref:ribosome recycling factor n=1 Tax=Mycoplasmoides pneumoniae TaxID=2104 RepID=UPI0023AB41C5|nr:ribosome recycling factor [Mycoplasmoides pneumoniae]